MSEAIMGPKGRAILLFDLDGICADLAGKWLDAYNRDWKDQLTLEQVVEWEWHKFVKPACGTRIYHYLSQPGFFADLEPIPGAAEVLRELNEQMELVAVTASPRSAMADKVAWIRRHLPFIHKQNIVITYRKDLVRGDLMFDDAPRNLRHFEGIRIMMDYPYNRDFNDCYRVRDWFDFHRLMEAFLADLRAGRRPPDTPHPRLPR